ncbi:hypothetical protein BH11PSE3_BH11PSE3_44360 [soil metagenome]
MKALIIDPALHSMGGHHYNAVLRLQDELRALGVNAPCLGSATADRRVADDLCCLPVFTHSVYGRATATAEEFDDMAGRTSRELSQALRWLGTTPDLVILPCCDQMLARAIAQQFKLGLLPHHGRLLIWFLYGPAPLKAVDDPAIAGLIGECRDAIADLSAAVGGHRLRAFCETSDLADFYRALGLEVGVLAGPGLVSLERLADAAPHQPPTVSCMGFANRPKGYHLLPAAIDHVLRQGPAASFLIHGILDNSADAAERRVFDRLVALGECVTVRQDALAPQDYLALLSQTDLLLLPYDPTVYRSRGSGLFSDARSAGIPVVATAGCSFAQPAFDEDWGVAFGDYSPRGLAGAISSALDDLDGLAVRAALAARQTRPDLGHVLRETLQAVRADRPPGFSRIFRRRAESA